MATDLLKIIRDEIKAQGLSQYRLARETGLAQTALGRFINGGDLYCSTASKLFDYLGLAVVRQKEKRPR
jgi:transcriptional regulator with XRE-family HTH domain